MPFRDEGAAGDHPAAPSFLSTKPWHSPFLRDPNVLADRRVSKRRPYLGLNQPHEQPDHLDPLARLLQHRRLVLAAVGPKIKVSSSMVSFFKLSPTVYLYSLLKPLVKRNTSSNRS